MPIRWPTSQPRLAITLAVSLLAGACLDPTRLNPHCAWIGDTSTAAIDVRDGAQRTHLANDVRIAGENAVRFAASQSWDAVAARTKAVYEQVLAR